MKSKSHRMKGLGIDDLRIAALAVVVLVIVITIGAQILGEMFTAFDADLAGVNETSHATNITVAGLEATVDFSDWFGIIVIVIIAAVILGLILTAFTRRESGL